MARPILTYAATSGSNANSGAGPATAVTGSNAFSGDGAGGGTQTVIDVSGDSPDLSGLTVDTDVLYLDIGNLAERHLFRITAFDNTAKTITVSIAPTTAISSGSPVAWGVGGKRATMSKDANRYDWLDMEPGWTFAFENEQQNLPNAIISPPDGDITNGPVTFRSADGASYKPALRQANTQHIFTPGNHCVLENLDIGFTGSVFRSCINTSAITFGFAARGNIFRQSDGNTVFFNNGLYGVMEDNEFVGSGSSSEMLKTNSGRNFINIRRNSFHGAGTDAIAISNLTNLCQIVIQHNVIYDCAGAGINLGGIVDLSDVTIGVFYNTIDNVGASGIDVNGDTPNTGFHLLLEGNALTNCGAYGVDAPANFTNNVRLNRDNHYHANTSGNWNNSPLGGTTAPGTDDTTGDPLYTSTTLGSEDYTPGAGSPLIDTGPNVPTA